MSDQYLRQILAKYTIQPRIPQIGSAYSHLSNLLSNWAGNLVYEIAPAGSLAKGTATLLGTDLDIYFCVNWKCTDPLRTLFLKTKNMLIRNGFHVREQNVSLGLTYLGINCDIVPAKKQISLTQNASLYKSKSRTWTMTNVHRHIEVISNSGRVEEMRVMKIWLKLHGLELPSFLMELAVIRALFLARYGALSENIQKILRYLAVSFVNAQIVDPANTANVVSSDATLAEKRAVALAAKQALAGTWGNFVW